MSSYSQVISGRWEPLLKSFDLSCCDCHLVHGVDIRVHNGVHEIRMTLNGRSTAALRRYYPIKARKKRAK